MTVPRVEKAYEKHAWILLFVLGIFGPLGGFYWFISGTPVGTAFESIAGIAWSELVASSPRVAEAVSYIIRVVGITYILGGIFIIAVSVKSYRRGETWAWYTFWTLPVVTVIGLALDASGGAESYVLLSSVFVLIISLLGLLLPYRKFFPRK